MERAPSQSSSGNGYMLYVGNLPVELNENGVRELFTYYGRVVSLFFRTGNAWGYVTYGTYQEAETAIKDLHDLPPLHLKVSFAKNRGSDNVQVVRTPAMINNTEPESSNMPSPIHSSRSSVIINREERLQAIRNAVTTFDDHDHTADDDLLYPYPMDPCTFNPYENTKPYESTNTLWTRGQLTVTRDGKRHVSLGRGYTMYQIPEPHPDINECIQKVFEKRQSGLYEYGKSTLRCKIGKCQKCLKVTKFTCERCYGFYCSKDCQVSDWPRHKSECQSIPALIATIKSKPLSESNNVEQAQSRITPANQTPLRRPKTIERTSTPFKAHENGGPTSEAATGVTTPVVNKNAGTAAANCTNTKAEYQIGSITQSEARKLERANLIRQLNEQRDETDIGGARNINEKPQKSESCADNAKSEKITEAKSVDSSPKTELPKVKSAEAPLAQISASSDNRSNATDRGSNENTAIPRKNFRAVDVPKMEEDIAFQQYAQLSKAEFTPVRIIVPSGNREYWVQKIGDDEILTEFMIKLQEEAALSRKVEPAVSNIYAVQYEHVWHRALVFSLKPLMVHYIDYGNDELIDTNDFREVSKYKTTPRFSVKIRLSEKAVGKHPDLKYEDEISVKMISTDSNKVINVEVEHENKEPIPSLSVANNENLETSNANNESKKSQNSMDISAMSEDEILTKSLIKLPNVIDTLTAGETGILEVHAKLDKKRYSVTLLPQRFLPDFETLLSNLPLVCMKESEHSDYKPCVGDLVCGQTLNDDWFRGYITSAKPPYRMAVVDEAKTMAISQSIPCPKEFTSICTFGAVCSIIDGVHSFKSSEQFTFKVTSVKNDKEKNEVEIKILVTDVHLKGIVTLWSPLPEQAGVEFAELKSGSEVCITSYRNQKLLYVRSLDTASVERYNNFMQKVAKYVLSAAPLQDPPVPGEMVLAKYMDNNYYRAIVTRLRNLIVSVTYVDFGNVATVKWKDLLVLSDDLKQVQSCTSKILLKDVNNSIPITKEANNYLSNIVGKEIPLVCTFDGDVSKDEVHLKLPTGESITEKLNELLTPSWKAAEPDKRSYMVQDLEVASLGNVGETVRVFVSYSMEDGSQYALCPPDHDLMSHVYETMPALMEKYCKSSEYYLPRENELCIGLYKDEWYRAVCVARSPKGNMCSLFYVDYGNLEDVDNKNIRYMPKDFVTPSALVSVCTIVNLTTDDDNLSSDVRKRISALIVPNQFTSVKIVSKSVCGMYNIEVPEIKAKLLQEGLI